MIPVIYFGYIIGAAFLISRISKSGREARNAIIGFALGNVFVLLMMLINGKL